jgi:hypothetical protein
MGQRSTKRKKGELRFPLAGGYVHDEEGNITFDPDGQVRHIQMIFDLYRETQSAYAVIQHLGRNNLKFPKKKKKKGIRWQVERKTRMGKTKL